MQTMSEMPLSLILTAGSGELVATNIKGKISAETRQYGAVLYRHSQLAAYDNRINWDLLYGKTFASSFDSKLQNPLFIITAWSVHHDTPNKHYPAFHTEF